MTHHLVTLLAAAALAACGSKASTPPGPSTEPAPERADAEPAGPVIPVAPPAAAPSPPEPPPPDPEVALLAAESSAWATAKPVFERSCAECHTKAGEEAGRKKLARFNMDGYPLGGRHARTIGFTIRDVLGISGAKPTMPYDNPGAVQGDDLAKVKAWTDAWEAADKAGAHAR